MEQGKFENQIREKMETRRIEPSGQAWDRLDAMLSIKEPKPKKNKGWFFVAASLVAIAGFYVILQYTSGNTIEEMYNGIENQQIISKSQEEGLDMKKSGENSETNNEVFIYPEEIVDGTVAEEIRRSIVSEPKGRVLNYENPEEKENVAISQIANGQGLAQELTRDKKEIPEKKEFSYVSPETLLAEVLMENKDTKIVLFNEEIREHKIKVNSMDLLQEAEEDLNRTFRDKVIHSINKNYNSIRSSIAGRNLE